MRVGLVYLSLFSYDSWVWRALGDTAVTGRFSMSMALNRNDVHRGSEGATAAPEASLLPVDHMKTLKLESIKSFHFSQGTHQHSYPS